MKFDRTKLGQILFCAVFFLLCSFFSLGMLIPGASEAAEGAEMPALIVDGKVAHGFGNDLESWFAKRFAYRGAVVDGFSAIKEKMFATGNDQVVVGKEGFLFFGETLDCYTGAAPMTEEELMAAADVLAAMQAYTEEQGTQFVFVCAPNKSSIYGEMMPDRYAAREGEGDLDRLHKLLDERGVHYCDLRPALTEDKDEALLYHKRDTHWNGMGAFLGYEKVMERLGRQPLDRSTLTKVTDTAFEGDLDGLLYPGVTRYDENTAYDFTGRYAYTSAYSTPMDMTITTRTEGGGKALIFRDSFANAWIAPFATTFQEARFERANPYRLDLLASERYDVVIVEIAERNLRDLIGADERIAD